MEQKEEKNKKSKIEKKGQKKLTLNRDHQPCFISTLLSISVFNVMDNMKLD